MKSGYCLRLIMCLIGLIIALAPHRSPAEEAKNEIPSAALAILAKAGKLMNDKEYDKAIALLTDFQAAGKAGGTDDQGRQHAEVHAALGSCYLLEDKFEQAARALELALQRDPRHIPARLNLAKAAYELGDYQKAAECFVKGYELAPDKNPEHLYFAAVAYLLAKENRKSLALFERLQAASGEKFPPEWRENMVHALLGAGEGRAALPHIIVLAEEYRGDKQTQWREILLHQYLQLDMLDKALALAERLSAQDPTEAKWWRTLVSIHLQQNRYQPALTALLIAGYLEPLSEQERRLAADLYLQLGVPGKAAPLYESLLEKGGTQLLGNLVVALQQLGQTEQALAAFDTFGQALTPELSMLKADLLYGLGKFPEAARFYTQAAGSGCREKGRALKMAEYAKGLAGNEKTENVPGPAPTPSGS